MPEPRIEVREFQQALRSDFFELHSEKHGSGWCYCVAWWTPEWEGWNERTAVQNRKVREQLLKQGEYDGYLIYQDDRPVGWCQVGRRDRLEKLRRQFSLQEDAEVWAITCFLIAPQLRRTGLAKTLLNAVLDRLQRKGVELVMAFPKRSGDLDEGELWNGPASMFFSAGFIEAGGNDQRMILVRRFENRNRC